MAVPMIGGMVSSSALTLIVIQVDQEMESAAQQASRLEPGHAG